MQRTAEEALADGDDDEGVCQGAVGDDGGEEGPGVLGGGGTHHAELRGWLAMLSREFDGGK